jgi:hypothetical protein
MLITISVYKLAHPRPTALSSEIPRASIELVAGSCSVNALQMNAELILQQRRGILPD